MYNNNDFCNWPLFYTHIFTHNHVAKRVKFLVFGTVLLSQWPIPPHKLFIDLLVSLIEDCS